MAPRIRIWAALLLALTSVLLGPVASAAPATPPARDMAEPATYKTGRIAFVRGGSIFAVDSDGTDLRQLTHGAKDSNPEWSPGGFYIAFIRGDGDGGANLWMMNADGSNAVQLTTAGGVVRGRIAWTDNWFLAFGGPCRDGGRPVLCGSSFAALNMMDMVVPGEYFTVFNSDGRAMGVAGGITWSTSREQFTFESADYPDVDHVISTFDPETAIETPIASCGGGPSRCDGYVAAPTYDREGKRLAFDAYTDMRGTEQGDYFGVRVVGADGEPVQSFRQSAGDHNLAYAPQDNKVVLQRGLKNPRLVIASAHGRHRTPLCPGKQPAWGTIQHG